MTDAHPDATAGTSPPAGEGRTPGARLDSALAAIRSRGRIGIMTHIVFGYPTYDESRRIAGCMAEAGVDLIEVQIPFSDPTADGPAITRACQEALDGGARVPDAFAFMEEMTRSHDIPFLFMTYLNIAFSYLGGAPAAGLEGTRGGLRAFVEDAAKAGACGLIMPDMPPDEKREGYSDACREFGVHPIYVVSPNVRDERLELVSEVASGFLYSTSRTGTTGREMELELDDLTRFLGRAREICRVPLAVGFSISKRQQIEALAGHADIAVIGTHLLRVHEERGLQGLEKELRELLG